MAKIGRPGLSREKRVELWERWKSGQCASDIARALERTKGAIHHVLAVTGGIVPVARRRGPVALVLDEREEISRGIAAGRSIRRIAASLGRSPSTVSREVARHGGRSSYRATEADARAWERALRPKPCHLASHPELRWRVAEKLALDWFPEQISGWLNNSHMATLVERHSRFAMLIKVRGKDTASVVSALSKQVRRLPVQLRRSLTLDRGKEMADHKNFTIVTDVQVYFCDPRSPWQRGSNENTNGLLRQYFPQGTDLSGYSQSYLNKIALRLNQRPRKTLGFETPADRLRAVLQ